MNVFVNTKQAGDFTMSPITVTRSISGEVVYCNHAEATEETYLDEHHFNDGTFVEINKKFLKCYKCGAWKDLTYLNNQWEDAPEGGSYE